MGNVTEEIIKMYDKDEWYAEKLIAGLNAEHSPHFTNLLNDSKSFNYFFYLNTDDNDALYTRVYDQTKRAVAYTMNAVKKDVWNKTGINEYLQSVFVK